MVSEIRCAIMCEFQNEIYFNELDKFLHNNKIILNYIQNCNSTGVYDYENMDVFIDKRIERFIVQYPQFFHINLYYNIQYFEII